MKAKQRSAAQVREDCIVYDKPVTLQQYTAGAWQDVQHLHASQNRAVSAEVLRYIFRLRYFPLLEDVRRHPQTFRLICCGDYYAVADYDDYNERRRVIRLTAERMICGTVKLITESRTQNDEGQYVTTETVSGDIFCTVPACSETEWGGAQQRGYEAEICLTVFASDYSGQRICEWNGKRYEIYRRQTDREMIPLYLGTRVGV